MSKIKTNILWYQLATFDKILSSLHSERSLIILHLEILKHVLFPEH